MLASSELEKRSLNHLRLRSPALHPAFSDFELQVILKSLNFQPGFGDSISVVGVFSNTIERTLRPHLHPQD